MSDQTKYANQIAVVKQECPDADESEIGKEFARYEEDFLIPPEDALRSVIRKFQVSTGDSEICKHVQTCMACAHSATCVRTHACML